MNEIIELFKNRSTLTNLLVVLLLLVGLPIGLGLVRQQQNLRSQAGSEPIIFIEGECIKRHADNTTYAVCGNLDLELTSPLGPGIENNPSPSASSSASPSASPFASPTASSSTNPSSTPRASSSPNPSSGTISFITQPVSSKGDGGRQVDITFKTNICPASVTFYYKLNDNAYTSSSGVDTSCDNGTYKATIKDLRRDKNYDYYVEVKDANGNSARSSIYKFKT